MPAPADAPPPSFGEHLRGLRRALGLSVAELAERSKLEISALEAIEGDARSPELAELFALGEGLGMRLSTVFRLLESAETSASSD